MNKSDTFGGPRGPGWTVAARAPAERGDAGPPSHIQGVLSLLEEQAQVGFWVHELATDRITASPGLAQISGIPVTAARTRDSMLSCIHPQDRPYQSDMMALIDNGQPLRREFRIVRPDGTIRWVSTRIDVVLGDDGRPVRFVGVMVDITERREAQRAIEYNNSRNAALLEATSALSWTIDPGGKGADYGDWCGLTGMQPDHCRDGGWLDAVHPNDRDRLRAAQGEALAQGSAYSADYRVLTKAGTYRWFNARGAPVRDASGAIREWQGVLMPIDDHPSVAGASPDDAVPLTGPQIRGARGLLDWSLAQLAAASGVSVSTIKRMEDGSEGNTRASKAEAVRRALVDGGVAFRRMDGATWISR